MAVTIVIFIRARRYLYTLQGYGNLTIWLLDDHLTHCVTEAAAEGGEIAAAKVREASDAIARLVKS